MFSFIKSIAIQRSPSEVFRYVVNPYNIPEWRPDVIETKVASLPLHTGDKIEEIIDFNGLQNFIVEVVDMVPDKKIVYKTIGSSTVYLPLRELRFDEEGEHTRLTASVSVHTDGFSRLIQPISLNMFSIKWETYLFQLKKVLESKVSYIGQG